jgi:hypothetical protein
MHMVHRIQQPNRPIPLQAPNIQHKAHCDPGANISATNDINVLRDTVALKNLFPISSANRTAPAMTELVRGTFFYRSMMVLHVISQCTIVHPLLIPSCLLSTLQVQQYLIVGTMDTVSLICQVSVAFSCHIQMIMMRYSLHSIRVIICISLLSQCLATMDLVCLIWSPNRSSCLSSGTSVLAIHVRQH